MQRLKINIPKSLYRPLEVEIEGKIFPVVKQLTRDVLEELEALDAEIKGGKLSSAYKQLEILFGKSKALDKVIAKYDFRQIVEITKDIVLGIMTPEKNEKNESGSGDEKLPS